MKSANSGFTLFELLVVMAMTAVITLAVYGSYRSIVSTAESNTKRLQLYEMAAGCLERMRIDLQGLAVRPVEEFVPTRTEGKSDPLRIRFQPVRQAANGDGQQTILWVTSRSAPVLSPSDTPGIAEIRYHLTPDGHGGWHLHRVQRRIPVAEEHVLRDSQPIVCSAVRSVEITAIDDKGKRIEKWDSNAADARYETPNAVFIRLEVGEADNRIDMGTVVRLPVHRSRAIQQGQNARSSLFGDSRSAQILSPPEVLQKNVPLLSIPESPPSMPPSLNRQAFRDSSRFQASFGINEKRTHGIFDHRAHF